MSTQDPIPYLHSELSLLSFHERVLHMALDEATPLLERLRFLSIFSSNLDEFFEIRVTGLKAKASAAYANEGLDGITAKSALETISEQVKKLTSQQYQILNKDVLPGLEHQGISFKMRDEWSSAQAKWVKTYFKREILPILTPIRLDPSHPFPLTINKGLSIVVDLHDPDREDALNIAILPVPRALPRFIRIPEELEQEDIEQEILNNQNYQFVYLSSIIAANIQRIFSNVKVLGCYQFRITRNSDLYVDAEEVEDLARALEGELPSRLYGDAIRLEVSQNCPKRIINLLKDRFQINEEFVFEVDGPVNLNRLISLPDMVDRAQIKYPSFTPSLDDQLSPQNNIFETISNGDVLLHHPFQSFAPVVDLLRQASRDPDVLAIKQTLYRTGSDSILVQYLAEAARAGKEVTVIVELMARFDEENNLTTAQKLQSAGAHVVYGMVGRKTHAKMLLIVRKEGKKLRRYVHLGTGNYHQGNTRVYTDYGLLTNNKAITSDVHELFMQLTTQGPNPELEALHQSPYGISEMLLQNIQREAANAEQGLEAKIIIKANGLSSATIINALYEASQAGVEIRLIIRGICTLRPKLEGISENIEVRSIVGRFLEHARVFYFENSEAEPQAYIASADLMPRNLRNRIEQCVPIFDGKLIVLLKQQLDFYLQDTTNAWILNPDGRYTKIAGSDPDLGAYNAQQKLLEYYSDHE